jgi:hypothetical protein
MPKLRIAAIAHDVLEGNDKYIRISRAGEAPSWQPD